jgi:hypothetical protein
VPQVHDVWRAGAPSIDILAPDAHIPPYYDEVCARFTRNGNPLFIPETEPSPAHAILDVAKYNGVGFSAIGMECARTIGSEWWGCKTGPNPASDVMGDTYNVLNQLAPMILAHQGSDTMAAVSLKQGDPPKKVKLGNYMLTLSYTGQVSVFAPPPTEKTPAPPPEANGQTAWAVREWNPELPGGQNFVLSQPAMEAAAVLIATGPDEYYFGGGGMRISFLANTPGPANVGLGDIEEGMFVDGKWEVIRQLAGDDTAEGEVLVLSPNTILRVTLYRFP